ncbi:MAG TPA: DNA polymerase III subunit delta [Caulobacteraceae bacterium]
MILSKRPEIERFLGAPPREIRAVVIYGRDRGQVRERGDALAARIAVRPDDPFDVALLTDSELDGDGARLEGELSAISMMGGRRLVRLRLDSEKAGPDKAAAEALKRHIQGDFNPEAFFLVEAGALGRDSGLRRAAEQAKTGAAIIVCYEDEPGDVARLVRESLARDQVGLTADALQVLVDRLPRERGVARQEIERLALFLGPGSGKIAGPDDLEMHLGVEPEASLADAAAHAFGGRLGPAQAALRRARAEGESGPAAVRALGMYLGRLRQVLVLHKAGAGLQEAAKAAGVFWKNEREFLRQARGWSLEALQTLQPAMLDADRACKRAGSPDGLISERLAMAVAARAKRRGL